MTGGYWNNGHHGHHGHHGHGHEIIHIKDKHPTLEYHGTYYDFDEAMNCWHVQTAAKHHGINLAVLAKALSVMGTGVKLITAIISISSGIPPTIW